MIQRSLPALALALSLAALPTLSLAQTATNAPAAPAPTPAPAAAPQAAPTEAPAPAASGERPATYTLQSGDTLESVGKQWGLTGRQLQRYNHLTNRQVRRLQIGTVIKIPPAKDSK